MRRFNPHSQHHERAVQAWQILIGAAGNRQTITYGCLGKAMYPGKASGVLNKVLGHVAFYCKANRLPVLTSIVVGKRRGTPGHNIPLDLRDVDKEREKVYKCKWYKLYPPSAEELHEAFIRHP
jgi:hypothetical protein